MGNNKGVAHLFIAFMITVFAMIGAWYVYKSYQENILINNLHLVYSDYKNLALCIAKDSKDKKRLEVLFNEIENIIAKYNAKATSEAVKAYIDAKK